MSDRKGLSARQYLGQLEEIDISINQELEQLAAMRSNIFSTGGIDYSKDRVQTSPTNAIEEQMCAYVDFAEKLNRHIDKFVDAKQKIIDEIRGLHQKNYIDILFRVYVQRKSIRQAAGEMQMSYSYAVQIHKRGLKLFEETYKNLRYLT